MISCYSSPSDLFLRLSAVTMAVGVGLLLWQFIKMAYRMMGLTGLGVALALIAVFFFWISVWLSGPPEGRYTHGV